MGNPSNPVAVLISDIHYSLPTLEVADTCLRQAFLKAEELGVPLIVAGDLHDTKANLRGECISAIMNTFEEFDGRVVSFVTIGNHDKINEKSEDHALHFLRHLTNLVSCPIAVPNIASHLVPYFHEISSLKVYLATIPPGSRLIMHQGLKEASSGEYYQDPSAITKDLVADFRVISGHYHTRQDIKTGRPRKGALGLWSYIGNPYTLNFGEAKDPEKGFQILLENGLLEFVPTNVRRHVVEEIVWGEDPSTIKWTEKDLLLVKVSGALHGLTKDEVAKHLGVTQQFRLDMAYEASDIEEQTHVEKRPQAEVLDSMIDSLSYKVEQRTRMKSLWRDLYANRKGSS